MPTDVPWTILARALESSHEISLKEESRQMCDCLLGSKKVKLVLSVVTCFLKIFFISQFLGCFEVCFNTASMEKLTDYANLKYAGVLKLDSYQLKD